jgi:hypothetical protein
MSGEWIGVLLVTALLVIVCGYAVFLALRSGGRRTIGHTEWHAAPDQGPDRKAA